MREPDDPIFDELQNSVRDVFARRGEMAGDALIVVEVIGEDGVPSLVTAAGDLSRWNILGRLDWVRADIAAAMVADQ